MKKIFTLITIALLAIGGANAQTFESNGFKSGTYEANTKAVLSGSDGTLTYYNDGTYSNKFGDDAAMTINFKGTDYTFDGYVQGKSNPKDAAGKGFKFETANLPTTGTYITFTAKKDGVAGIVVNVGATKSFYFIDTEDLTKEAYTRLESKGSNDEVFLDSNYCFSATDKFYGVAYANVKAGKTYYIFCAGSKICCYGYIFAPGEKVTSGISTIKAATTKSDENAPIYNVAGQRVDKNYKGIVIQNGKKFVNNK